MPARWLLETIACEIDSGALTVQEAVEKHQVSRSAIYRYLQQCRAPGEQRVKYTPHEYRLALAVSAVILRAMSKKKKRTIPTHLAITELVRLGHMQTDDTGRPELSVRRANQLLKALGISARHMRNPSPCVRLQAAGPNHVHEADFTEAAFVYLDNLTVRFHRELTKKKKPAHRTKILLGVVKDHFSRAILAARAYPAKAEGTRETMQLLHDAWSPKLGTSGLPHGLPWNLYTDQGPGFTSRTAKTACKALFISLDPHSPGNPRATGLAEGTIKSLTTFQHLLKARMCQGVSIDLDQLNAWMQEWAIDQNTLPHPMTKGTTRVQAWQNIVDDDIRRCPPWDVFCKLGAYRDEPRKVASDGTIKLDSTHYAVGTEHHGRFVYPYKGPDNKVYVEIPGQGITGPLQPGVPLVAFGTFKPPPLTTSEKRLREVRQVAEDELGYTPDDVEYQRRTDEVWLPREGRKVVDDAGSSDRFYASVFEAKSALADTVDLGSLPHEVVEEIERTLEDRADKAGLISTAVVDEIAGLVSASDRSDGSGRSDS